MNKKNYRQLFLPLLATLSTPSLAAAYRSGSAAMDKGIGFLGSIFYPSVLLRNEMVQVGFFKFLYFIILFATINLIMKKYVPFTKGGGETEKRASGIIAFAIAAIGAFFLPPATSLAVGGLITVILSLLLPLGIAIGITYVSFKNLNKTWYEHLIGAALILLAIWILTWTVTLAG